mgnify:CR=1 FL=1
MANYFVPLTPQRPGQGINLEPVNAALDGIVQQNNANRAFAFQQKQFDANQQQRQFENARATKQDQLAEIEAYGKRATAVDQLTDPNQRAAAWKMILARHGTDGLTPEELDPVTGPKLMAAQAGQFLDPRDSQAKDLGLQKTQAEIKKLNAEAANGVDAYGKTGTVVQGADGKFYSIQFGSRGQRQILPLELGGTPAAAGTAAPSTPPVALTPSRGVDVVGDTIIDKATGAPVRNVGSNIAAGEQAKVVGRETGKGQINLPKSRIELEQSKVQNDTVLENIDKAIKNADNYTSGFTGAITSNIPGTKAYDQSQTLATIKANLGFDKLQAMRDASPTGGALGQVSEMENRLLQSVWGSVEQSQSPKQLRENLTKIKSLRLRFQALKQQAYDKDVARFGKAAVPDLQTGQLPGQQPAAATSSGAPAAPAPASTQRPRAVNPQTGHAVEWDGTKWIDAP